MQYLTLTVFKDTTGTYPSGLVKNVPYDSRIVGMDTIDLYDVGNVCAPDQAPTKKVLQLLTPAGASVWVDETQATYEAKRAGDCCAGGKDPWIFTLGVVGVSNGGATFTMPGLGAYAPSIVTISGMAPILSNNFTITGDDLTFTNGTTIAPGDTIALQ